MLRHQPTPPWAWPVWLGAGLGLYGISIALMLRGGPGVDSWDERRSNKMRQERFEFESGEPVVGVLHLPDAQVAAELFGVPTSVVHSEHSLLPDLAHESARLPRPRLELWLESQGQVDFYDDPVLIGPAADAITRFFAEALGSSGSGA
jgi:hypothetical protein